MNTLHNLEEIVFEKREKSYGAYFLRKQYQVYLLIAFFLVNIGVVSSLLGVFMLDKYQTKEKGWDGIVCNFPPLPPLPNGQENVFSGFSAINSKGIFTYKTPRPSYTNYLPIGGN